MYTVQQLADHLGVHEQTIYTWIRTNKLHVKRFGTGDEKKRIRITQEQVDEFMQ